MADYNSVTKRIKIWILAFIAQAGMSACIMITPLALPASHIRQIPPGWQLIDCSSGFVGMIPLWVCKKYIDILEQFSQNTFKSLI